MVLGGLAALTGIAVLVTAARVGAANSDTVVERVNELLPQSQCARCGYPGCRPYADAIVNHGIPINRCAPGGDDTVNALARLLEKAPVALDTNFGTQQASSVAVIDEALCIGCARCLEVCPVDAIAGAHRYLHTVIAGECTGCELCLPPCPVNCIHLEARRA